jgi:hypothetical protein
MRNHPFYIIYLLNVGHVTLDQNTKSPFYVYVIYFWTDKLQSMNIVTKQRDAYLGKSCMVRDVKAVLTYFG